jgi:hypothetical protein
MVFYLDDSYQSFQCPVSILRYGKGDRQQSDYALVQDAQLFANSLEWIFE